MSQKFLFQNMTWKISRIKVTIYFGNLEFLKVKDYYFVLKLIVVKWSSQESMSI